MDSYIQELIGDIQNKQREAKYLLWQSFLVVNGFLITVVVTVVSFGSFRTANNFLKIGIETILIILLVGCGLIIYSFKTADIAYKKMGDQLKSIKNPSELKIDKEYWKIGNRIILFEKINILIELIAATVLLIVVFFTLFL